MAEVIEGRKAGQSQASSPSIADDTIASISRLKALYLLSAGEIKGLANGAASIMLEGTPLVDDNNNPNFENVEWEIRTGTVDQTHIAGMPSASNEIGINVALSSDTPYIRSITNTQLSSINVNISFPLLKKQNDDGDIVGVTVAYAIDVQTDGNGYVTMLNTSLTAKTSGRYQKTYNVKLPEAQNNWQIRVRKITADGDNELLFNSMQIDSIAEIIDAKLRYPCSALLYLSFDAKTFSNIPKLSVDMQGVYVQVPSNYDTVTRTSTGIWDGTFKQGYTTNPAWHYYDLITNKRYGLGDKIQPFMINKWALEHIARVCDEPVDDGKGGTEPRFTCNLYLQVAEDAYQVLQHIAGIFRGMSFWNGSQIVVDADTARDAEYVITRANVINGAFVKTGSAASDRHTSAKVAWSNPANAYETEYVMVRNEQAIAEMGINILDLSAVGCTSEGQAYRMGLAALLAELNRTQTVSFAMGLDGSLPSVGSRLDIADMMFTGANTGGRISSVNANRTVITVDRDNVPVVAGDKLIVNLESGKAQERVITAINGRAITVAIAFDAVASQNVWAVSSLDMPTMPFIVMSVVQNEDGTQYNYTAMQYDPTMYAQIDNGTIIEQRPVVPKNNPYIIAAPEVATLDSRHRVVQGLTVTTLEITWAQVKDAIAYDVEWRKDDGDWIKLPRTGNISAEVDGVYSGNYLARVKAVSAFDAISKPTTSTLTAIAGKVGLPPVIVGLTATGVLFGIELSWGFGAGSGDSDYTELQVGSTPDVNVAALGQFSYPTNSHTINGLQGGLAQSYRARLVDKLGNKSPWSAWVTATVDNSADKVLDLVQGQIDESSLNQALTTKIDKININRISIIDEAQARFDDILEVNKRMDDNFIVETDVEYYLSSSATSPVGGTWQTTAPAYQQSKYIFSRTKTTLGNGIFDYSPSVNGTNITGAKGDTGAQGVAGQDGIDGQDGYTPVKGVDYFDGVDGTDGSDGDSAYQSWLSEGNTGSTTDFINALRGADGQDGSDGIAGVKGADGVTTYTWVKYADSANGVTGFSNNPSNKPYIGFAFNKTTATESDSPSDYTWSLIKGADGQNGINGLEGEKGDQGIQGVKGADGVSSYTHLAYGTSSAGANFSTSHFANATYIGMYVDNLAADSTTPSKYKWSLIKGADGTNGIAGAKGADGLTPYLHIAYATNATGTTGFSTTVSTGKTHIGQYTDNVQTDSTDPSKYKWTLIKGDTGNTGAVGQGVESIVEEYAMSNSKTVAPTNWSTTPPVWTQGNYVWTRSKITYKNPTEVKYTTPVVGSVWDAVTQTKTDFIEFEEEITDELGTQGEKIQGIISDYKPRYTDASLKTNASRSQQWTYWQTVARDNYASNERITSLQSEFADSNANFTNELFTLTEQDKSIASDITQLYAETSGNYGLIQAIDIAISTPSTGLAAKVTELQASSSANADSASAAQLAADSAAQLAGNKGEVIYQWQTPSAARQLPQNLWIDTNGGKNTPKRWDGSAWVVVTDKAAIDAQAAADAANNKLLPANLSSLVEQSGAFADDFDAIAGNITNIEGVIEGQKTAIEVTSAVGSAEKLKNEIAKARLDKDVTTLNAQNTALTNSINAYTAKVTELTTKRDATADIDLKAEYNRQIADINAAKTDLTAQRAAIADQVIQLNDEKDVLDSLVITETGIKAQYTIKIDAGGAIVGYGLAINSDNTSDFNIRANNINFLPPANGVDDGVSQFVVFNTASVIDGVTVPAGAYARHFYAPRASIDTIQIKDAAIKSAQIDALAVKSANIDDLAVTTGKIKDLAVDTLKIADYAVTIPRIQFTPATTSIVSTNTALEVNRLTINAEGGTVGVSFGFERLVASGFGSQTGATVTLQIKRLGLAAPLRTLVFNSEYKMYFSNPNGTQIERTGHVLDVRYVTIPVYLDNPPSGDQTYIVEISSDGVGESSINVQITARSLHLMGAKK